MQTWKDWAGGPAFDSDFWVPRPSILKGGDFLSVLLG
jgi:hypothetical protein